MPILIKIWTHISKGLQGMNLSWYAKSTHISMVSGKGILVHLKWALTLSFPVLIKIWTHFKGLLGINPSSYAKSTHTSMISVKGMLVNED